MPSWTWTITFGQTVLTVPLLMIVYGIYKIHSLLRRITIEHEILMQDWANKQVPPILLKDFFTRRKIQW